MASGSNDVPRRTRVSGTSVQCDRVRPRMRGAHRRHRRFVGGEGRRVFFLNVCMCVEYVCIYTKMRARRRDGIRSYRSRQQRMKLETVLSYLQFTMYI